VQWEIVRTTPVRPTHGLAIPAFIHNMQYHYAPVAVYGDGLIDCWELVDLDMFRQKLRQGWVVTEAPVGGLVSFFNLGWGTISACNWQYSATDLLKRVEEGVDLLNPSRTGLISIDELAEVRYNSAHGKPYRVNAARNKIAADSVGVFLQAGSEFRLTQWFIYADGSSRVGVSEPLSSVSEVATRLNGGDLCTSAPDGARIVIEGLGWFESQNSHWHVKPEERVREAYDILGMLKGEPGSRRQCLNCFDEYQTNPNPEHRERLRLAYEAVPEHLRFFCGDMDSKDGPIRQILYGESIKSGMAGPSEASTYGYGKATPKVVRILVVENGKSLRDSITSLLDSTYYKYREAKNEIEALASLDSGEEFDLVLSTLMGNLEDVGLVERMHEKYPDIPVVIVTAAPDLQVALRALRHGAYDYLLKPLEKEQLLSTVRRVLESRRIKRENDAYRTNLESLVNARTQQWKNALADLERAYEIPLEVASDALQMKNAETAGHSKRVTAFAIAIAKNMHLPVEAITVIGRGAFLHDIGKMAIPNRILLKPTKLTEMEMAVMREHCLSGHRMLKKIPFLVSAAEIVYAHHENYDGTGYPRGVKGTGIPMGARIVAIANTLDSITSDLPYRPAQSFRVARREIERCSGKQFDPEIVRFFLSIPERKWEEMRRNIDTSNLDV
jgi:putative nucleotidyltransferase with HDIG domain